MKKTLEELHATAMLMGMWYDQLDHTMNDWEGTHPIVLDADTLEPLSTSHFNDPIFNRRDRVARGEIGYRDIELEQAYGRRK